MLLRHWSKPVTGRFSLTEQRQQRRQKQQCSAVHGACCVVHCVASCVQCCSLCCIVRAVLCIVLRCACNVVHCVALCVQCCALCCIVRVVSVFVFWWFMFCSFVLGAHGGMSFRSATMEGAYTEMLKEPEKQNNNRNKTTIEVS
jgi:hypothetical protein